MKNLTEENEDINNDKSTETEEKTLAEQKQTDTTGGASDERNVPDTKPVKKDNTLTVVLIILLALAFAIYMYYQNNNDNE